MNKPFDAETVDGHFRHCHFLAGGQWCTCGAFTRAMQQLNEAKCDGEPDCGWHNGGPCRPCKAKEAA